VPGEDIESIDFASDQSLLDADIILFEPTIGEPDYASHFQGKPSLAEHQSFRLKAQLDHWRSELTAAIEAGKLVIVFLATPTEVYAQTGERQYSGTGRNRQVTNIVGAVSSYRAIPFELDVHPRRGTSIVRTRELGVFAPYWDVFGDHSPYEVTIESRVSRVLLKTKAGDKIVGGTLNVEKGSVHLLPPLRLDEEKLTVEDQQTGEVNWTDEGLIIGKRLINAIVALDDALRAGRRITPIPDWAQGPEFRLQREFDLDAQATALAAKIEKLQKERLSIDQERQDVGKLRRLLYEQGEELEFAILDALRLLGFKAEGYEDKESEFDAVFVTPEGVRYLGEAEGKDTSAINVDKFSQLERNIQEDYAKEQVTEFARGALFGNAFRLTDPGKRGQTFTSKCLSSAKRSGVALVRTPDLFEIAKYLTENPDPEFAAACRRAIESGGGAIVAFPSLPVPPSQNEGSPGTSTSGTST